MKEFIDTFSNRLEYSERLLPAGGDSGASAAITPDVINAVRDHREGGRSTLECF